MSSHSPARVKYLVRLNRSARRATMPLQKVSKVKPIFPYAGCVIWVQGRGSRAPAFSIHPISHSPKAFPAANYPRFLHNFSSARFSDWELLAAFSFSSLLVRCGLCLVSCGSRYSDFGYTSKCCSIVPDRGLVKFLDASRMWLFLSPAIEVLVGERASSC